ncbi:MAG: hypothetical protein ABIH26_05750 [Candidatus Eisenbacteria bacterium]
MVDTSSYIVVDASLAFDYGPYVLDVTERFPPLACEPVCPPGAVLEGEPECSDGYVDTFNGGCYAAAPAFSPLPSGFDPLWVCGESGIYDNGLHGDSDWYAFTLTESKTVTFSLCANFDWVYTHLFMPDPDCSSYAFVGFAQARAYETATISASIGPGTYWYAVAPYGDVYLNDDCGEARYLFKVEGLGSGPTGAEPVSWGALKTLFR